MSDTPRTDAAEYKQTDSNPPEPLGMVDVDFARQLERELNEANIGAARYEYLRTLNKREFAALVDECLYQDLNFDTEVDRRRNQS